VRVGLHTGRDDCQGETENESAHKPYRHFESSLCTKYDL